VKLKRGLFSVYGNWQITNVDKARLNAILTCQDTSIPASLLINRDDPHFQLAQLLAELYQLLATGHPGWTRMPEPSIG
jgi:hypothetical protein